MPRPTAYTRLRGGIRNESFHCPQAGLPGLDGAPRIYYRTNLRHGVSRVKRGIRFALGVIYHDSQ